MWMARVELRSSVTIDGISTVLPLPILRWVEVCEEVRRDTGSRCKQTRGEGGEEGEGDFIALDAR